MGEIKISPGVDFDWCVLECCCQQLPTKEEQVIGRFSNPSTYHKTSPEKLRHWSFSSKLWASDRCVEEREGSRTRLSTAGKHKQPPAGGEHQRISQRVPREVAPTRRAKHAKTPDGQRRRLPDSRREKEYCRLWPTAEYCTAHRKHVPYH